ncbi:MAG: hypothetical protein CMF52_07015 [Legionellales bacterium]|nr:hypothetical protein [Legionellales bacterium]|tara:strand:+ start:4349 stop:4567 length:219 start_codon:yes stop_codon:yes gene_type:complete
MCLICIELDKKTLTPWEAEKNLTEFKEKINEEHEKIVKKKIDDAKNEFYFEKNDEFCCFCQSKPCDCKWDLF